MDTTIKQESGTQEQPTLARQSSLAQLPIKFNRPARELLNHLATTFIIHITQNCHQICHQNKKQIINADHILSALSNDPNFSPFIDKCCQAKTSSKINLDQRKVRRSKSKNMSKNCGVSEEELAAQQELLFREAAEMMDMQGFGVQGQPGESMNDIKTETIATTPTEVRHENVLSMQNIKQESSTSKNSQMESLDFGEEEDDEDEYT